MIDTNKYHYITYRYKIDGYQDIGGGWATRFIWWYTQPAVDQVTLDDVLAYEGWKVYSFDLKDAVIDPTTPNGEWSGQPNVFRFDLHEIPDLANSHLDFMKLTGDEVVRQGEVFPIYFEKSREGVTASVYYDTNRNRADGRNLAERFDGVEQITNDAPFSIFLPALITQPVGPGFYEIDLLDGEKFDWNTSGVNHGVYYISIDLNDGVNTTTWYSDVPVYIVP